eukprot:CAMPEP_0116872046 /NCGR_PEP_ID=MMETSP0463-20121206/2678_1 /TAXON_ID=181622 /ORGANISM="Strombidinopsis sp, Strain SopsisLIS2011" /LENGTH=59 /DNA_ID=CAMNT_0004511639 /DNA_START=895 /DNA_END=1074 /DNA_ORIENTATION=+
MKPNATTGGNYDEDLNTDARSQTSDLLSMNSEMGRSFFDPPVESYMMYSQVNRSDELPI